MFSKKINSQPLRFGEPICGPVAAQPVVLRKQVVGTDHVEQSRVATGFREKRRVSVLEYWQSPRATPSCLTSCSSGDTVWDMKRGRCVTKAVGTSGLAMRAALQSPSRRPRPRPPVRQGSRHTHSKDWSLALCSEFGLGLTHYADYGTVHAQPTAHAGEVRVASDQAEGAGVAVEHRLHSAQRQSDVGRVFA